MLPGTDKMMETGMRDIGSLIKGAISPMLSMLNPIKSWIRGHVATPAAEDDFQLQRERLLKRIPVPVFWLFGKTGSGKTSIVRYLTGSESANIGNGFRPETKFSSRYDFPFQNAPILQFLDTRGLGEIGYDPHEDIHQFDRSTHVMIVTVRALDHAVEMIIEPLKAIRRANPRRPVLLALTYLHEAYPGQQHPDPDPFSAGGDPARIPEKLRRSIDLHRQRFAGLYDAVVAIDLTQAEDGYIEPNFGGQRLKDTLIDLLPASFSQAFMNVEDTMDSLKDLHERRASQQVMAACTFAAAAAAVPIPWIDIPAVAGIQSHMVYQLARIYRQELNAAIFLKMASGIGGRVLVRQVLRQPLKLIPGVGQAVNAALAYAYTYGLGKACCWYYGEILAGNAPTQQELEQVIGEQMSVARQIWSRRNQKESSP